MEKMVSNGDKNIIEHEHFSILPNNVITKIFGYLTYDEIAKNREVCKHFNNIGKNMLNAGLKSIKRRHAQSLTVVKKNIPRAQAAKVEYLKFGHYSGHFLILHEMEEVFTIINATYGKYIKAKLCCFIPGSILDEINRLLWEIKTSKIELDPDDEFNNLNILVIKAAAHFGTQIAIHLNSKTSKNNRAVKKAPPKIFKSLEKKINQALNKAKQEETNALLFVKKAQENIQKFEHMKENLAVQSAGKETQADVSQFDVDKSKTKSYGPKQKLKTKFDQFEKIEQKLIKNLSTIEASGAKLLKSDGEKIKSNSEVQAKEQEPSVSLKSELEAYEKIKDELMSDLLSIEASGALKSNLYGYEKIACVTNVNLNESQDDVIDVIKQESADLKEMEAFQYDVNNTDLKLKSNESYGSAPIISEADEIEKIKQKLMEEIEEIEAARTKQPNVEMYEIKSAEQESVENCASDLLTSNIDELESLKEWILAELEEMKTSDELPLDIEKCDNLKGVTKDITISGLFDLDTDEFQTDASDFKINEKCASSARISPKKKSNFRVQASLELTKARSGIKSVTKRKRHNYPTRNNKNRKISQKLIPLE